MKVVFTKHVKDKLLEEDSIKLGISKNTISNTIKKPIIFEKGPETIHSVGKLNDELSLSVIWKVEKDRIKVITFYPARKGRYESQIL